MKTIDEIQGTGSISDPTLGAILQRAAYAQLPSRFYALLQACLPLAVQCWTCGWHRTAGWLVVLSAFGIWALAQQQIEGYEDAVDVTLAGTRGSAPLWRALRKVGAVVGSLTALALLLEGFAQVMAGVFQCPGCSG